MSLVIALKIAMCAAFEYSLSDLKRWLEEVFAITIFDEIAELTKDKQGVSRESYGKGETDAINYLSKLAVEFDLHVEIDNAANVFFSLKPIVNSKYILVGSHMDSVPLVCISGQVPTHLIGTDAFQECDTTGITRPCTKHNWLVKDVNDLADIMNQAFKIATTGRPGPVLVDIPKDIQFNKGVYKVSKNKLEKKLNVKVGIK